MKARKGILLAGGAVANYGADFQAIIACIRQAHGVLPLNDSDVGRDT